MTRFQLDREAVAESIARSKRHPLPSPDFSPPEAEIVEFATRLMELCDRARAARPVDGSLDEPLELLEAALASVTSTFFAIECAKNRARFSEVVDAPISRLATATRRVQGAVGEEVDAAWFESWIRANWPRATTIYDLAVRRYDYDALSKWCLR